MSLALHGYPGGRCVLQFEVLKCRKWVAVNVEGIDEKHTTERAIEIYGWSPVIRKADTKKVIWRRKS